MNNAVKQLLEFGPFRLDPEQRLLLRDRQPVPLSPKAFDLLLVLVLRSGEVVLKDDLMKLLWPDTFVEESNLGQHVFQLRKALGERAQDHSYIVTVPGRGYRFAQKVRALPVESEEIVVRSRSRSRMVIEEETLPARPSVQTANRRWTHPVLWLAGVGVLIAAAVVFRPEVPAPKVSRIRQLTHLGTLVYNTKVVTDGPRIYFRAREGQARVLRYVSPAGGEVFPVESALSRWDIDDISSDGSEFLISDLKDPDAVARGDVHALWRVPVSSGSARPIGGLRGLDSTWSPDGSTVAYTTSTGLYLANGDGSNSRRLPMSAGEPFFPHWSPDGRRIRFSLADPLGRGSALWQADPAGNTARPLLPDWPASARPRAGGWTSDGRYFFFTALGEGTRDVWAMREPQDGWRRVSSKPVRLSAGPLDFYQFTPSKDGKSVFAIGQQLRGQLERYDMATRQYSRYAQGVSADHVAFSRDGQWMAYVEDPQGILVRCRVDGSARRQLTFAPMRAMHPQWSPDGARLAFQAAADLGSPNKIYVISRDGGLPGLATRERSDRQRYPSWSSSGESIVFSASDQTGANSALYSVDMKSKQVSWFPGTTGLYWGQISPDGRHLVALTEATQKLTLYDTTTHDARTLAGQADYPIWSADGKDVYYSTLYFRGPDAGVYRFQLSTNRVEKMMGLPDFLLGGIWGVWFGLTPTGDPLVVRDLSSTDLYALDLDLP
jgi:DNA-binding winged helix-turn-helix (wHTH) protein/Tol biopolymer transport system component